MALVNVSSALKKDEIKELLLAQESPKYTFVKIFFSFQCSMFYGGS